MKNKFVGLIILDGYGLNEETFGNAIKQANPVNIDYYLNNYPYTTLFASGEHVGLPEGQIGNSEVGHLNIGAGTIIMQSLQKINHAIKTKTFYDNQVLNGVIDHVKTTGGNLHLMGLTSSGGVHAHINHLFALIDLAKQKGVKNVFIHVFTDGRDTLRESSLKDVKKIQDYIKDYNGCKIATVIGRFYAMDREKNWERTQKAYNALVYGKADIMSNDPIGAIKNSYASGVYDEFLEPVVITHGEKPVATIGDNDGIIFYNFREDRARQITYSLVEDGFDHFERKELKNVKMASFTLYDKTFKHTQVAFFKDDVKDNLSAVVSRSGLKQFKITETTKYAHVTYFLNGNIEVPYEGEERFLIETIKTANFDEYPQMRAREITQKAIEEIKTQKYNLMVLNYSNCDMLGHTGNLTAAIETVKVLNEEVKKLVNAILDIDGIAILTADHGNAECMIDKQGNILTDHTTNKVPFAIVGNNVKDIKLKQSGVLGNIAPTILHLLGVEKPQAFTLDSLIE